MLSQESDVWSLVDGFGCLGKLFGVGDAQKEDATAVICIVVRDSDCYSKERECEAQPDGKV